MPCGVLSPLNRHELKSTRHAKYLLHAHLVFTQKYRKKIFIKEHLDLREEVFTYIYKQNDSELVEFDGESDHIHLLVWYPPRIAISVLVNSLKGVSSRRLRQEFHIFKENIEQQNTPD